MAYRWDLQHLTEDELRREAEELHLSSSGTRDDLIERIHGHNNPPASDSVVARTCQEMAHTGRLEGAANPSVEHSEQDVHVQRGSERISTQNAFPILPVNNAAFALCLYLARNIEEKVEGGVYEKSEITATIVVTESCEIFIGVNSKARDMRLKYDITKITNQIKEAEKSIQKQIKNSNNYYKRNRGRDI